MRNRHIYTGYIAAVLSALFGVFTLLQGLLEYEISGEMTVAYWSVVMSLFIFSVVESLSDQERRVTRLVNQPFFGIELYEHSSDFIDRLIDVTKDAEVVCTINFSPPRGKSRHLDKYFKEVQRLFTGHRSRLKSFMSIANIESAEKAEWILTRALELRGWPGMN